MEIGILGLPLSGKSTLFEIMTGIKGGDMHGEKCVRGLAAVPDKRFSELVDIFKPVKVSPAQITFIDVNAQGKNSWDSLRQTLSSVDGLLHMVDGFSVDTAKDCAASFRKLEDELILSDLIIIEKRLEKLVKMPKNIIKPEDITQIDILKQAKTHLEEGRPFRAIGLTDEQIFSLRSFSFWTIRPELVCVNLAEDRMSLMETFMADVTPDVPTIGICCFIEAELIDLSPEDRKEYLASMGIEEPAFPKIIRTAFSLLNRISFFTVGEDEVKAWVIPARTKAPKAAATIHKDFERGFIKAEVCAYDDFIACGGTLAGTKSAGKLRLEGKEYIVKDGDIITFRFNV
jgi:GTP-binding protein YchF